MLHQHVNELLRKVLGNIRIAIGHMGYEIDQFPQRNDPSIGGCRWRGHENLAVAFILEVLGAEILDVGSEQSHDNQLYCHKVLYRGSMQTTYFGSRLILCCKLGLESREKMC